MCAQLECHPDVVLEFAACSLTPFISLDSSIPAALLTTTWPLEDMFKWVELQVIIVYQVLFPIYPVSRCCQSLRRHYYSSKHLLVASLAY